MYVLIIACASHKENINVLVLLDTCNKNSLLRRPNQGRTHLRFQTVMRSFQEEMEHTYQLLRTRLAWL